MTSYKATLKKKGNDIVWNLEHVRSGRIISDPKHIEQFDTGQLAYLKVELLSMFGDGVEERIIRF